jgi:hypothetical protein
MQNKTAWAASWNVWIPLLISIVSFVFTAYSWYYQIREYHDFKASIISIFQDRSTDTFSGKLLLLNTGNRAEVMLSARLLLGPILGGTVGPVVLKPGDAVVVDMSGKSPTIQSVFSDPNIEPDSLQLGIIYLIADTRSGNNIDVYLTSRAIFTTLRLNTERTNSVGSFPSESDTGSVFIDLYRGQPFVR